MFSFVQSSVLSPSHAKQTLYVTRVLEALMENKQTAELENFLFFDPKHPSSGPINRKATTYKQAICFVIGGGCYVEYHNIQDFVKVLFPIFLPSFLSSSFLSTSHSPFQTNKTKGFFILQDGDIRLDDAVFAHRVLIGFGGAEQTNQLKMRKKNQNWNKSFGSSFCVSRECQKDIIVTVQMIMIIVAPLEVREETFLSSLNLTNQEGEDMRETKWFTASFSFLLPFLLLDLVLLSL